MLQTLLFSPIARLWRRPRLWLLGWAVYVCVALVVAACLQPPVPGGVCAGVRA